MSGLDGIHFGECQCDDPVPDPVRYELPDETVVDMRACAECGELIEWGLEGTRTEEELREVVRAKDARINDLEDKLSERPEESAEVIQQQLDYKDQRIFELEEKLKERPSLQELPDDVDADTVELAETVSSLIEEREQLREDTERLEQRVQELKSQPAENGERPPVRRLVWSSIPFPSRETTKALVNITFGLVTVAAAFWFVWPVINGASKEIAAASSAITSAAELTAPAIAGSMILVIVISFIQHAIGGHQA